MSAIHEWLKQVDSYLEGGDEPERDRAVQLAAQCLEWVGDRVVTRRRDKGASGQVIPNRDMIEAEGILQKLIEAIKTGQRDEARSLFQKLQAFARSWI